MNTKGIKETKRGYANARIAPSTEEKIEQIITRDGIQKSDFIRKAIEFYLEHLEGKSSDSAIELRLYRYNALTETGVIEQTPVHKISFSGYVVYAPEHPYVSKITDEQAKCLYDDFGILPMWRNVYDIQHALKVFYSFTNNSYIVYEYLALSRNQESYDLHPATYGIDEENGESFIQIPFVLDRCKFVSDYKDVLQYFSKYASSENLVGISYQMAEDIGDNYSMLDQLFEPFHKK